MSRAQAMTNCVLGEVIRRLAAGQPGKEVAARLGVSPRTLETYRARAMSKLGLRSRAELVHHAVRRGWLPDDDLE